MALRRVGRWQASATPDNGWSSTTANCISDIESVSTQLSALGLEKGDVLCLLLPNWTEAVIYTYAASRLGAVVCPITTIYRQRELSFILERTECKVMVIPSVYRGFDYAAMVHELADGLPDLKHVICVGDTDVGDFLSTRVPQLMGGSGHTPRYRPRSACRGRPEASESTGHTFDRCSRR